MKKAAEYRDHARECREIAASMPPGEARARLREMARLWDELAEDRERAAGARRPD
jgi:hypothetical protein